MRRGGALIFPGFELLDLFGPLEMFGLLKDDFDLQLVAETSDPVSSNQQVRAIPDMTFKDVDQFNVLFAPGGVRTRREVNNAALLDWIRTASETAEHVLSMCTDTLQQAGAGLLDGATATKNKEAFIKNRRSIPQSRLSETSPMGRRRRVHNLIRYLSRVGYGSGSYRPHARS
ncbi:MAG: DJ-1/PfpI family protein [Roseobacter sp.]